MFDYVFQIKRWKRGKIMLKNVLNRCLVILLLLMPIGISFNNVVKAEGEEIQLESGDEFLVNTNQASTQIDSASAALSNGASVIAWVSRDTITRSNSFDIHAQLFDADSNPVGLEFKVNEFVFAAQLEPDVISLANGNFLISWSSYRQDGSSYGVYAQAFDLDGTKIGSEFQINTFTRGTQRDAKLISTADGGFIAVWESYRQDRSGYGIYAQKFNAELAKVGSEVLVNTFTSRNQLDPAIAELSNGEILIAWESYQDQRVRTYRSGRQRIFYDYGVYAQRFDSALNKIDSEFRVNEYTDYSQVDPTILALSNGGFAIAWETFKQDGSSYGIAMKTYDSAAQTVSPETIINSQHRGSQIDPSLIQLNDEIIVAAWQDRDLNSGDISAQLLDLDLNLLGSFFTVNTSTDRSQYGIELTPLAENKFLASWTSNIFGSSFFGDNDINAKIFELPVEEEEEEVEIGEEFQIADNNSDDSHARQIIKSFGDGRYIVVWSAETDLFNSDTTNGVFAKIIDASGNTLVETFQVSDINPNFETQPDVAVANDGSFVVTWTLYPTNTPFTNDSEIVAKLFDAQANVVGTQFQVNTDSANFQTESDVEFLDNGEFIVTWSSEFPIRRRKYIYAQKFAVDGSLVGDNVLVNISPYGQITSDILIQSSGDILITWAGFENVLNEDGTFNSAEVFARRFDSNLNPFSDEIRVNIISTQSQSTQSVAELTNGDIMIAWHANPGTGGTFDMFAQRFSSSMEKNWS